MYVAITCWPLADKHNEDGLFSRVTIKFVLQDLGRGLKELLDYEGDVEEDLCQTFQVS